MLCAHFIFYIILKHSCESSFLRGSQGLTVSLLAPSMPVDQVVSAEFIDSRDGSVPSILALPLQGRTFENLIFLSGEGNYLSYNGLC